MSNITMILNEEKERLERLTEMFNARFNEVSAPAIIQKPSKNHLGEDVMKTYIDMDRFTPEQREQYDIVSKRTMDSYARLAVFNRYVKNCVSPETIQNYNQDVDYFLDNNKDMLISCNCIDLDENGNFTKYSIKVGPITVESPSEMSIDTYSQLYTTSLSNLLARTLGDNLTQEEVIRELQNACTELYLQQKNEWHK